MKKWFTVMTIGVTKEAKDKDKSESFEIVDTPLWIFAISYFASKYGCAPAIAYPVKGKIPLIGKNYFAINEDDTVILMLRSLELDEIVMVGTVEAIQNFQAKEVSE